MMSLVLISYILIIPLRFYDYYKFRIKLEERRAMRYAEKVPNTTNIVSTLYRNDLSISGYGDEAYQNQPANNYSPNGKNQKSSFKGEKDEAVDFNDNQNNDYHDSEWKGWKKKSAGNIAQDDNYSNNKNIFINKKTAESQALDNNSGSAVDKSDSYNSKEESKEINDEDLAPDLSHQRYNFPSREKKKEFELPKF